MNQVKRQIQIFLAICLTICLPMTAASANPNYNNIVFFGDSLTDNGNLYNRTYGYVPKSPPYFEGRFSNGPTWAELVADHYQQQDKLDSANYAVGSATAVFHNPAKGYLPYTLTMAVYNYYVRSAFSDRSHTLFSIWIGANDYLKGAEDVDAAAAEVVNSIRDNIERLISYGGKYFLVMNLPDLANSPFGRVFENPAMLTALAKAHNQQISVMIESLQTTYPEITIRQYDIYSEFDALLKNPEAFNKKYQVHITNVTESCWQGGYTLRHNALLNQHDKLVKQIETHMTLSSRLRNVSNTLDKIDANQLANAIINTPALSAAYEVGESYAEGDKPCENPDNFVFWDKVHPTRTSHMIFSKGMIEFIDANFK